MKTDYHLVPDESEKWRKPTTDEYRQADERRTLLREQLRQLSDAVTPEDRNG